MTMTMMAAAAAATTTTTTTTTTCPGRGWGHPEGLPGGVTPSPPRHFTFEPPVGPCGPPRPRRRHRRVLYPPVVRRPPPTEEPSAAKRLLVLLLAVVSAQVYSTPGDATPEAPAVTPEAPAVTPEAPAVTPEAPAVTPEAPAVTPEAPAVTPEAPVTPVTSLPGGEELLRTTVIPTGTTRTPNETLVGTPVGASCPRLLLLSPALRPHNCTAGGTDR